MRTSTRWRLGAVLASVAMASGACTSLGAAHQANRGSSGATTSAPAPRVTDSQVVAAVAAAAHITKVPANLDPPLSDISDIETLNTGGTCASGYRWPQVGLDALHFGECSYGDASSSRLMVVFGDSHAGMWLTSLKVVAQRTGWAVKAFYFPGCPAPSLTFFSEQSGSPNLACNTFRTDAIDAVDALHPAMVLVTSASLGQQVSKGVDATSAQWQEGYTSTLERLRSPGRRLVVIGDIPILTRDDPDCLAAHMADVQACATPLSQAEQGVYVSAERQAATAAGAQYIPTAQWICSAECEPIVGTMRVYNDQYHLSATYAAYLSGPLQDALGLRNA